MALSNSITLGSDAYTEVRREGRMVERAIYRTGIGWKVLRIMHKVPPNGGDIVHTSEIRLPYLLDANAKTVRVGSIRISVTRAPNMPAAELDALVAATQAWVASTNFPLHISSLQS